MIITEKKMRLFMYLYNVISERTDLRSSLVNLDFDILERYKHVFTKRGGRVRDLVNYLIAYRDEVEKARSLEISMIRSKVLERFNNIVESVKAGDVEVRNVEIDPFVLSKYFPVRVVFMGWDTPRIGYMFRVNSQSKKRIILERDELIESANEVLDDLIWFNMRFNHNKNNIELGGFSFVLDDEVYPLVLKRVGVEVEAVYSMGVILRRKLSKWKPSTSIDRNTGKVIAIIGVKDRVSIPKGITKPEIYATVSTDLYSYPKTVVRVDVIHQKLVVGHEVSTEVSSVDRTVDKVVGAVNKWIDKYRAMIEKLIEFSDKYGYWIQAERSEVNNYPVYTLSRGNDKIRVRVSDKYYNVWITIPFDMSGKVVETDVMSRLGVTYRRSGNTIRVIDHFITKDIYQVERRISDIKKRLLEIKKILPDSKDFMTARMIYDLPEHIVLLYLLSFLLGKHVKVEYHKNTKKYILRNIDRLIREISPEDHRQLHRDGSTSKYNVLENPSTVIRILLSKGYIQFNSEEIIINNERFSNLFKRIISHPEEYNVESINNEIRNKILEIT